MPIIFKLHVFLKVIFHPKWLKIPKKYALCMWNTINLLEYYKTIGIQFNATVLTFKENAKKHEYLTHRKIIINKMVSTKIHLYKALNSPEFQKRLNRSHKVLLIQVI